MTVVHTARYTRPASWTCYDQKGAFPSGTLPRLFTQHQSRIYTSSDRLTLLFHKQVFRPSPASRDGAETQWVVSGIAELGIRDIEVFGSENVVQAVEKVLTVSDRGVLVAEMEGPFEFGTETVWREKSRGFVLPRNWNPWPTVDRVTPFRRRYERTLFTEMQIENSRDLPSVKDNNDSFEYDERYGKFRKAKHETLGNETAGETLKETANTTTETVFDEMYPDRTEIDELGDDVRVGPRRVFAGHVKWKTETDFVSAVRTDDRSRLWLAVWRY